MMNGGFRLVFCNSVFLREIIDNYQRQSVKNQLNTSFFVAFAKITNRLCYVHDQ